MEVSTSSLMAFLLILAINIQGNFSQRPYNTRRNITLPTLRVAAILNPPFLTERTDIDSGVLGNERYEGFIKDLLDQMAEILDFKYRIQLSVDGKYGRLTDGRWSGLIGMVQNNQVDMIAADLTVTSNRTEFLDFSMPFLSAPLTVLTKKTSNTFEKGIFDFFQPFTLETWLLLAVGYLVTSLVLCFAARISPYENQVREDEKKTGKNLINLPNAFWFVFAIFFRGSKYNPQAPSTRLLTGGWFLFGLCIILSYTVGLNAFVRSALSGIPKMETSLQALIEKDDFNFGVFGGGASENLLKNSNDPILSAIYANIMSNPEENRVEGNMDGVELVKERNGEFGLVIEGNSADHMLEQDCDLYTVGKLAVRSYALAFPVGSRYRKLLSSSLLQLRNSGKLQGLINKWWKGQASCNEDKILTDAKVCTEIAQSMGPTQLAVPFIFLVCLILAGLVSSLVELLVFVSSNPSQDEEAKGPRIKRRLKEAISG